MSMVLRQPAVLAWAALMLATVVSWYLGADHGQDDGGRALATTAVLIVAFVKVRIVGMHFMELRDAPWVLRGLFEAWIVVVCGGLIGIFFLAG